jgi:hypothetical protein
VDTVDRRSPISLGQARKDLQGGMIDSVATYAPELSPAAITFAKNLPGG